MTMTGMTMTSSMTSAELVDVFVPSRCILSCKRARQENGTWVCPMFKMGVDKVSVRNDRGIQCRMFERKQQ